jgi:hypothetical protein
MTVIRWAETKRQKNMFEVCENLRISPTHKRTEGRAPVRGSEPTNKSLHYRGGEIRQKSLSYAELKVLGSGGDW